MNLAWARQLGTEDGGPAPRRGRPVRETTFAPAMAYLYYHLVEQKSQSEPKYRQILRSLSDGIASGRYRPGDRLPSEAELVGLHRASRITVNRALRELQVAGLIERRVGSGSYVRADSMQNRTFGLLIPELGTTEIFEPICRGIAEAEHAEQHSLLWSNSIANSAARGEEALEVCRQMVAQKISGVFLAPLELTPGKDATNRSIAALLDKAGISVVLLDRDLEAYPRRSRYDLVGIDNRRAGYAITAQLLKRGCGRTVFVGRPHSAPTVDARIAGFREALLDAGKEPRSGVIWRIEPSDTAEVRKLIDKCRPDGVVCANDFTAAHLMKSLAELGIGVPSDVRLVGIDDVKYASLLPVPLTTIHQPCVDIGAAAMEAMNHRLKYPSYPARDILLDFKLVVRQSCGASMWPA
jgi:GntR family transcriptional regulator of arabinose operon